MRYKALIIKDCFDCPNAHGDGENILCAETGTIVGPYEADDYPIPADCPLPDEEDAEQPMFIGIDFASGPDRTAYWPNNDADIAADAEEDEG